MLYDAGSSDDEEAASASRNRSVPPKKPRTVFTHKPASADTSAPDSVPAPEATGSTGHSQHESQLEQSKAAWTSWSLWNCVLFQDHELKSHQEVPSGLQRLDALQTVAREHRTWALVLSSGGHFAAAVFDMRTGSQHHAEMKSTNALHTGAWPTAGVHKTIHRCCIP